MHRPPRVAAILAAAASLTAAPVVFADDGDDRGHNRQATDTRADFTPLERFQPVAESRECPGAPSGRASKPFRIPPGYVQNVIAEESDPVQATGPLGPARPSSEDLWDMNTQNEFGKDAGRYLYRTHEVGAVPQSDPSPTPTTPGGAQVTVTDLRTGITHNLAERRDWERFDGIVWTPWGTILAAEETIAAAAGDPQAPQARGGLVYELFVDREQPWKLDPSRERITPGDGTSDTVQDGVRVRPAVGARSHEGLRFDKRGYLYGIAESRGVPTPSQSGAIFRFVPDRKGDLSSGRLSALKVVEPIAPSPGYGEAIWVPLDRQASQVDSDQAAEAAGATEYQRPEDVETGESTGRDRNNGGHTLYVAVTEDNPNAREGVIAVDLSQKERPFAYPYVGADAGNTTTEFRNPDNVALDRAGNLAMTEDSSSPPEIDVWIAAPPRSNDDDDERGSRHAPARTVQRFLTLRDCAAEPSGIYFALAGTEEQVKDGPLEGLVDDETLFVHRQHAGQTSNVDQSVAIRPAGDD